MLAYKKKREKNWCSVHKWQDDAAGASSSTCEEEVYLMFDFSIFNMRNNKQNREVDYTLKHALLCF